MRTIRILTPIVLAGLLGEARADDKIKVEDLPKAVAKAVKKAYPEAKIVGASKEEEDGETIFEVEMMLDGKSIDILLDEEGEIEETEKEIEVEDLPRAVLKVAKSKFPGAKINKVEEVTDEDDTVVYELVFEVKGKKPFEVVMAPNGKILDDDDEDDDDEAGKKDKDNDEEKGKVGKKKDKDDNDEKEKPEG
ncbi:PepSY-like domain-containing protein [Tundrisphaera lichenicola]|uniref:PepSY-like domain-containing protein n=1 Tax=Tundrisphaera lichenicola TaxID=2029860 RepID=UPI003EBB817F